MTIATPKTWTLEEYLTYDDGTDAQYELVDGVLVAMGAESTINTRIAMFLIQTFLMLGLDRDLIGIKQKIAVPSAAVTARDPDLIIHSEASTRSLDGASQACLRLGDPQPQLVIEVVSPGEPGSENYDRDYVEKPREYGDRGIPEFWLVDPVRQVVWVLVLEGQGYQWQRFVGPTPVISPTFPGLKLPAEQILRAGR